MDKLIINYAPVGMLMKKADTPNIPISVDEIVDDVRKAVEVGISSLHLHARNEDETPCWNKETFEQIILRVREFAPDLVISVTTSGRVYNALEKRSDVLNLEGPAKPDMASLSLSSLNFNNTASVNAPDTIKALAEIMLKKGIRPELEAFDLGMINYAKYLIKKGYLTPPYYFNLIVGNIACAQANLLHVGTMINDIPDDAIISLGGIGNNQLPINAMAIAMGYGVRIGLEDNIWYDENRTRLATNLECVQRIHKLAKAIGRPICTSRELREKLKLKPGFGEYGC